LLEPSSSLVASSLTGSAQEEAAMEKIKVKIRKLEKIETTMGRKEGVG
jgi:hypothetical protein